MIDFALAGTVSGNSPRIFHAPEAAAQTFNGGDVVTLVAGKVTVAGADPLTIAGIAIANAEGVTDTDTMVISATYDNIFMGQLIAGQAIAIADLFANYEILVTGGSWEIEKPAAVAPRVKIVGFVDPVGTVAGRVLFKFLQANTLEV